MKILYSFFSGIMLMTGLSFAQLQEQSIGFGYDSSSLTPAAKAELSKVVSAMRVNTHSRLYIFGHTDSKGSAEYNRRLSQRRGMEVVMYLLDEGFSSNRWIMEYFGEDQPVAPNTSPDGSDNTVGRKKNRRVDLKLQGYGNSPA